MSSPVEFYHLFFQKASQYYSEKEKDWEKFLAEFLLIEQIFIDPSARHQDYLYKISRFFSKVPISIRDTLSDWRLDNFHVRKIWRERIFRFYRRYYEYMENNLWEEAIKNLEPWFSVLDITFPKAPNQVAFVRASLRLIKIKNNDEIDSQEDFKRCLFKAMPHLISVFKETLAGIYKGEVASVSYLNQEKLDIHAQYEVIVAQCESLKEEIESLQKYIENPARIQEDAIHEVYRQWNIPSRGLPVKLLGDAILELDQNKTPSHTEQYKILSFWVRKLQEVFEKDLELQVDAKNFGKFFNVNYHESFQFRYLGTPFKDTKEKKEVRVSSYGWEIFRKALEKIVIAYPEVKEKEGN